MVGESFGALIRSARRRLNKSLQDVADALGVTAVYVSEVERGRRPPFTHKKMPALAEVLMLDLKVLLTTAWSQKGMIEWDPASASDKEIRALVELARGGFTESELDAILKIAPKSRQTCSKEISVRPLTGIKADRKHSYQSIETVAAALRQKLELEIFDQFDAREFFDQHLAEMVLETRKGCVALREAVDECPQEGSTRWDDGEQLLEIVLSPTTYELLQEGHVRARSTVAHECGHAILHTEQIIRMTGLSLQSQVALHRERGAHEPCQDTEWQANAFGSALLMPAQGVEDLVLEADAVGRIASIYGVSRVSAGYRLETYRRSLGLK